MDINKEALQEYYKDKDKEHLLNDIFNLCQLFCEVNEFYQYRTNPNVVKNMLSKYMDCVENALKLPDYALARSAVETFCKICDHRESIAELKLFHAEVAISFSNEYNRISTDSCAKVLETFENALQYIFNVGLEEMFKRRVKEIVNDGSSCVWNIAEGLRVTYSHFYGLADEENYIIKMT